MRNSLVATLRRHRAIVAALTATLLAASATHAQALSGAQPAKAAAPKTAAAPATPVKAPAVQPAAAPKTAPQPTAAKTVSPAPKAAPAITPTRVYVDINHATLQELKNIPGIGDVYAARIIAGRPYANKSQLVSKKIINAGLYDTIQGMIIAKQ